MKVTIKVLPSTHGRRINWRVYFPNGDEFSLLGKDEFHLNSIWQNEIRNKGESKIITQARLKEEFGAMLTTILKEPGASVTFDDSGFFDSLKEVE